MEDIAVKVKQYIGKMKDAHIKKRDTFKKDSKDYNYWDAQVDMIEVMEVGLFELLRIPIKRR